jgi:hypothetical protein
LKKTPSFSELNLIILIITLEKIVEPSCKRLCDRNKKAKIVFRIKKKLSEASTALGRVFFRSS